jgi:hypothetical protein
MAAPDPGVHRTRVTFAVCGVGGLVLAGWLVSRAHPFYALEFLFLVLPALALAVEVVVGQLASRALRPGTHRVLQEAPPHPS